MLQINAEPYSSVANYIESYRVYTDWYNSCHNEKIDYLLSVDPDGIPVYHIFADNLADKIQNDPSDVIFIDNSHETINTRRGLEKLPKEKFYIILSNGKWDPAYYQLSIKYINLTRYMFFYEYTSFAFNRFHLMFHADTKYNFDYPKEYEFVSTTGTVREERDKFVEYIRQQLVTDNFIFRYSGVDVGKPAAHLDSVSIKPNQFDSSSFIPGLEKYYYSVLFSLPIDMYNQAYYNLVVEGDIDCPHQFCPTEKVVKALLTGMPFVLVGSPQFLEELKKLGFKTYNELWDESYDDEFDYDKRMQKILELCNYLSEFDWEKHKNKLIEIGNHNRECFMQLEKIFQLEYQQTKQTLEQYNDSRC